MVVDVCLVNLMVFEGKNKGVGERFKKGRGRRKD
jgi:hypothetical protein